MAVDLRVAATFNRQSLAVRTRVQQFAAARFTAGQYRDADVALFVRQVAPVVLAGRRQVSAMTDAYLTQVLQQSGIKAPRRGPIDTAALRGVPVEDVYARPYQTVWTSLSKGDAFDAAVSAGAARLGILIATDMQMAKTYTSRDVLSHSKGVTGYQRVPSGVNTCALCELASTQMYSRDDLMPIHPSCGCSVEPVTRDNPWDQAAADERYGNAHAAAQDQLGESDINGRAPDYRKAIAVRDHGEIGPVLVRAADRFTGPSQIEKAASDLATRLSSVEKQISVYEPLVAGGGHEWMSAQLPRLYAERDSLKNAARAA